jgi:predicted Zn-dependent protease with MMP-like domain
MNRADFERIVRRVIERLPEPFHHALENVAVVVEEEPDRSELDDHGIESDNELLGVYLGVPLTDRGAGYVGLPDRIVIYRGPILRMCESPEDVALEIRDTVIHELGHHMGLSDEEMPY